MKKLLLLALLFSLSLRSNNEIMSEFKTLFWNVIKHAKSSNDNIKRKNLLAELNVFKHEHPYFEEWKNLVIDQGFPILFYAEANDEDLYSFLLNWSKDLALKKKQDFLHFLFENDIKLWAKIKFFNLICSKEFNAERVEEFSQKFFYLIFEDFKDARCWWPTMRVIGTKLFLMDTQHPQNWLMSHYELQERCNCVQRVYQNFLINQFMRYEGANITLEEIVAFEEELDPLKMPSPVTQPPIMQEVNLPYMSHSAPQVKELGCKAMPC